MTHVTVGTPWRCSVNFAEMPPSKQWAALKYKGDKFAEVWFKPEGEPFGLTFRIPQQSFQVPGLAKQLTIEKLLKAVAIMPHEVDSWRHGDILHSGANGSNPDFKNTIQPPPPHATHLDIHVRLPQPSDASVPAAPPSTSDASGNVSAAIPPAETETGQGENGAQEVSPAYWQDLEVRWKAILGIEAAIDTLRLSMEALLIEMEGSSQKSLTLEEKNHGLRADIAQWQKARNRVHTALPKMRDFVHRATWAMGSPERKRLEEIYKDHIQPQMPFPQMDDVLKQLEDLHKDRQILSAQGTTVYQECKGISADIQGTLRMLQGNAAANALRKKSATGSRRRF
jgi:hypothetical protein